MDWLNQMSTDVEPASMEEIIRSFDRKLRKIRSKHLLLRGKHWKTIRYYQRLLVGLRDEVRKLDKIGKVLMDACETYNDGQCQNDCDCDPNGWEGCYTRKILDMIYGSTTTEKEVQKVDVDALLKSYQNMDKEIITLARGKRQKDTVSRITFEVLLKAHNAVADDLAHTCNFRVLFKELRKTIKSLTKAEFHEYMLDWWNLVEQHPNYVISLGRGSTLLRHTREYGAKAENGFYAYLTLYPRPEPKPHDPRSIKDIFNLVPKKEQKKNEFRN